MAGITRRNTFLTTSLLPEKILNAAPRFSAYLRSNKPGITERTFPNRNFSAANLVTLSKINDKTATIKA